MRAKDPEGYQAILDAQAKGVSPQQMVKEMMQKVSPEQTSQIMSQAKSLGVPDNIIQQIQNFK